MLKSTFLLKSLYFKSIYSINISHPKCFDGLQSVKNLSNDKIQALNDFSIPPSANPKQLNLLVYMVQKLSPSTLSYRNQLANYILTAKITSNSQIDQLLKIFRQQTLQGCTADAFNWEDFEKQYFNNNEDLEEIISQRLQSVNPIQLKANSHQCTQFLNKLKGDYCYHPQNEIYRVFNRILDRYCHSTQTITAQNTSCNRKIYDKIASFFARDLTEQQNTREQFEKHIKETEGKIVLRFPPEPNGHLHLGHVRSIRLNFYSAEQLNGKCYLRFDDTNPSNEKDCYIEDIKQNLNWFGYKPTNISYASDYFPQIFDSAIKLIKKGKAYICEQNSDEISQFRKSKLASPYRGRSIDDSLKIFHEMQQGLHMDGKFTLRLKIDPTHLNPTMRDPVIFRVKNESHPRTGMQWKVYPMYDFAHCICDSLENITHSLCTLEFEIRRDLYFWILNELEMYKPTVYEFSRLNIENNILSKRKIKQLVEQRMVDGWDDPRLLTINGLRKRGYTTSSLNTFIDLISVSRSGNENRISMAVLENCLRKELDESAPRLMAILDPVKLTIIGDELPEWIEIPVHKKHEVMGKRKIKCSKEMYIERKDVRLQDESDYFGLAPGKKVALKYFAVIQCEDIMCDDKGEIKEVKCKLISQQQSERKKLKGQLHWISVDEGQESIVKEYSDVFHNIDEEKNIIDQFNKNSVKILSQCKIPSYVNYNLGQRFQFERNGYYIVDEIQPGKVIFNKIVSLQDKRKN